MDLQHFKVNFCIAFEDKLELDINIFLFAFPLPSYLNSENIYLRWQILETVESTCIFGNSLLKIQALQ